MTSYDQQSSLMYHRPTPYSIALATLICLHNNNNNSNDSNNNNNDTNNDIPIFYNSSYNNDNNNIATTSTNENNSHHHPPTPTSSLLFRHVDTFLQQQMLTMTTTTTASTTTSTGMLQDGDNVALVLHGPNIYQLLHDFYHSLLVSSFSMTTTTNNNNNIRTTIETTSIPLDHHDDDDHIILSMIQELVTKFYIWLQMITQSLDTMVDFIQTTIQRSIVDMNHYEMNSGSNKNHTSNNMIDRTSMNGIYLRSLYLGYETLSFVQVIQLYESIQQQIHHINDINDTIFSILIPHHTTGNYTTQSLSLTPHDRPSSLSTTTNTMKHSETWIRSSEQVDHTLRQYCYNNNTTTHDDDDDATNTMMMTPSIILDYYPQLPSVHFLTFMTAINQKERVHANHALYEFIDQTFIQSSYQNTNNNSTGSNSHPASTEAADILQYASILQTILHVSFCDRYHMTQAMEEAIRVTQQQPPSLSLSTNTTTTTNATSNRMNTSTLFAMAWSAITQQQNHNNKTNAQQQPTVATLLQRCMDSCRMIFYSSSSNNNNHLLHQNSPSISLMMGIHLLHAAMTNSWISHDHAITFYTIDPISRTSGSSSSSSNTNMTTTTTAGNSSSFTNKNKAQYDRPIHTIHLDNPSIINNVIVQQKLVAAKIYHNNNEISLSISTFVEILEYYSQTNPQPQRLHDTNNNNNMMNIGNSDGRRGSLLIAIRNVSLIASTTGSTKMIHHWVQSKHHDKNFGKNGPTSTLLWSQRINTNTTTNGCIYQQAIVTYVSLCDQYSISIGNMNNKIFMLDMLFLFHEWAVRRNDIDHANAIMTLLENYDHAMVSSSTHGGDNNLMMYHKVLSLSRQKQYSTVISMLTLMIEQSKTSGQHRDLAWALLQISRMYIESDHGHQKGQFINALQPVLECLSISKQHKIYGLYNEALLTLAHIHLLMGQYHRAMLILQTILPTLLSSHHVSIQAEAFLLFAKCRMKQVSSTNMHPNQLTQQGRRRHLKVLKAAIQELNRSRMLYERCHGCRQLQEIHYLLAHAYNHVSQITTNNDRVTSHPPKVVTNVSHDHHEKLRDMESTNCLKYTKRLSTTASSTTVAQFMTDLTTLDGIMMLANRSIPI